jgi:hypothetical protein
MAGSGQRARQLDSTRHVPILAYEGDRAEIESRPDYEDLAVILIHLYSGQHS